MEKPPHHIAVKTADNIQKIRKFFAVEFMMAALLA
jgi:hypothetical protein